MSMTPPTPGEEQARRLITLMINNEELPHVEAERLAEMTPLERVDLVGALASWSASLVNVLAHHRTDVDGPGLWQMLCSRITAEENA